MRWLDFGLRLILNGALAYAVYWIGQLFRAKAEWERRSSELQEETVVRRRKMEDELMPKIHASVEASTKATNALAEEEDEPWKR